MSYTNSSFKVKQKVREVIYVMVWYWIIYLPDRYHILSIEVGKQNGSSKSTTHNSCFFGDYDGKKKNKLIEYFMSNFWFHDTDGVVFCVHTRNHPRNIRYCHLQIYRDYLEGSIFLLNLYCAFMMRATTLWVLVNKCFERT